MIHKLQNLIRNIKVYPFKFLLDRSPIKTVIERDINRWLQVSDRPHSANTILEKLTWLLYAEHEEEFRNLFYYRIGSPSRYPERFMLALSKKWFKPLVSLRIATRSIGPGLVIRHGYGTFIEAREIGENCLIFQDVVIGYKNETGDIPIIGNYVHIAAGSRVLGNITIGDHAVIASNSVVTKDLPPNSLAMGIPARIIENAGNKAGYIADGEIPGP